MKTLGPKNKNSFAFLICVMVLAVCFSQEGYSQRVDTPDYWKCEERVGGEWRFGRAPYACNIDTLGDPVRIEQIYSDIVFEDLRSRGSERSRYMRVLQTVIRDVSLIYLKDRKPSATAAERKAFERAIYTLAHSESFWSHYRRASDNKMKIMRGDFGHGHGLMQVDDRWHFNAIKDGDAWDLIYNMEYALNIFYNEWQRAPSAWCVPDPNDWETRTRSAWAAYNGGPSKLCRWTSDDDAFSRNDVNFYEKYVSQSYDAYIDDYDRESVLNVACLMSEGSDSCKVDVEDPTTLENTLLKVDSDRSCILDSDRVHCMNSQRNTVCLERSVGISTVQSANVSSSDLSEFVVASESGMTQLCRSEVPGLLRVGATIQLNKNINFRRTPGGFRLATAKQGTRAMIVDFEVRNFAAGDRYYKFLYEGEFGFVYAGDDSDFLEWAEPVDASEAEIQFVASVGDEIEIVAPWGINLRQDIGGEALQRVPNGASLEVLSVEVLGESLNVYYQVRYSGQLGFIYGGQSSPNVTYRNWAVVKEEEPLVLYALRDELYYRYLLECGSFSCNVKNISLLSSRILPDPDKVTIIKEQGAWREVQVQGSGETGWIRAFDLVRVEN